MGGAYILRITLLVATSAASDFLILRELLRKLKVLAECVLRDQP